MEMWKEEGVPVPESVHLLEGWTGLVQWLVWRMWCEVVG